MSAPELLRVLAGLLFVTAGVIVIAKGIVDLRRARRSVDWPATEGVILNSQMHTSAWYAGPRRTYRAQVRSEYCVRDRKHSDERIRFGDDVANSWALGVDKDLDTYPPGKAVQVHYDPENPRAAVLEPGVKVVAYAPLAIGAVLLVIGLGAVFGAR